MFVVIGKSQVNVLHKSLTMSDPSEEESIIDIIGIWPLLTFNTNLCTVGCMKT